MKTKTITKVILSLLIILTLIFNTSIIDVIYVSAAQDGGKVVQERPIDGQRIVEIIEESVRNFWEVVRLDRLFDVLIEFFQGVWKWAENVFREGLERVREYQPAE